MNSTYKARGSGSNVVADLQLVRSTVEGASIQDGTTLHVATDSARMSYAAAGGVGQLDPQRVGRALHIDNLSEDRFHGQVNASFNINGSGRTVAELAGHADARLQDSTLLGGHIPDLLLSADVRQHALEGVVRGRLDSFDPASLTGRADLAGSVAGTADLSIGIADLTLPSDLAGLQARGNITVAPSKWARWIYKALRFAGLWHTRLPRIERGHLESSAGTVDAAGDVALGEQGSSTLTYDVALTDLAQLGKIAGRGRRGYGSAGRFRSWQRRIARHPRHAVRLSCALRHHGVGDVGHQPVRRARSGSGRPPGASQRRHDSGVRGSRRAADTRGCRQVDLRAWRSDPRCDGVR